MTTPDGREPAIPTTLGPARGGHFRDELLDFLHCAHFLSPHCVLARR